MVFVGEVVDVHLVDDEIAKVLATALQGLHNIVAWSAPSDDESSILVLAAVVPSTRIRDYSHTSVSKLDHVLVLVESCREHFFSGVTPECALHARLVAVEGKARLKNPSSRCPKSNLENRLKPLWTQFPGQTLWGRIV